MSESVKIKMTETVPEGATKDEVRQTTAEMGRAALEAAFQEVTIDDVLAEERPEQKSPTEMAAEKLGATKLAEIVIGAISEARANAGDYYDYLQRQADDNEVPYEDILLLVRERVKAGYDDRKEQIKFYYSLSEEDFARVARAGKLERADWAEEGYEHRPSDLQLSKDTVTDEGTWTGFGDERGAKSSEVTLVFGGDLIDEASFDALNTDTVRVDEADLQERCLAVVTDEPKVKELLTDNGLAIPVYGVGEGETSWYQLARETDELAAVKEKVVERHEEQVALRKEVLTEVDVTAARERAEKLAEQVRPEDWDQIFEAFQMCETDAEYEAAEELTFTKLLERLGVKGAAAVRYLGEDDPEKCYLTVAEDNEGYRMWVATLSRKMVPAGAMSRSVETLAHEAGAARAVELAERLERDEELSAEEQELAEKYSYNLENFVPMEVDLAGYRQQLIEVDAAELGEACAEAFYTRYETKHKTPLQKVAGRLQEILRRPEAQVDEEAA